MSKHYSFGVNEQGVETRMEVMNDGTIITGDYKSGAVVQSIIDKCASFRRKVRESGHSGKGMKLYASIPVTLYTNWRRLWDAKFREHMNWQEFSWRMLNRPEYAHFKCTDEVLEVPQHVKEIGDHATTPQLMTSANCAKWRAEERGEKVDLDGHYIPMTSNDDAQRISC